MKNFLKTEEGYIHEVFNLCCKYESMDLWHGKCPPKENPMSRIRNIVERYHLKRDEEATRRNKCIYAEMATLKKKRYIFEERFKMIGRFQSTEHRRVFMHTILDTAKFEKECGNCGKVVEDTTKHGMGECKALEHHREVYILRMKLYNAPENCNLLEKKEAIKVAMMKNCFMKVVCDFLLMIWNWNIEE